MSDLWWVIGLSLLVSIVYLWFSVNQQDSNELSSNNQSWRTLIFVVLILAASPSAYFYLGNHEKQEQWQQNLKVFEEIQQGTGQTQPLDIQNLVLSLRSSIDKQPKNGRLWFMLAESYFQLRMIDLADKAISRAIQIEPKADWLVANAQILSARFSESDINRSIFLLNRALQLQPEHQSAMLTLGFIHLRKREFQLAVSAWQKLLVLLESGGNDTTTIKQQISYAQKQLAKSQQNSGKN